MYIPLGIFCDRKAVALRVKINDGSLTKTSIDLQCCVHLLIPSVYLFWFSSKLSCFPAQFHLEDHLLETGLLQFANYMSLLLH